METSTADSDHVGSYGDDIDIKSFGSCYIVRRITAIILVVMCW